MEFTISDIIKSIFIPLFFILLREVYSLSKSIGGIEASFKALHDRIEKLEKQIEKITND